MKRILPLLWFASVLLSAALTACAGAASLPDSPASPTATSVTTADKAAPETVDAGPFRAEVQPIQLGNQPTITQAKLVGQDVLGLFTTQSSYDIERGNQRQDANVYGRQQLAQSVKGALPLPLTTPLQLNLSANSEQTVTAAGIQEQRNETAQARWSDLGLRFALDAKTSNAFSNGCSLDTSLSAAPPEVLRRLTANASDLALGGQLCSRLPANGTAQQAEIVSARANWNDSFGARRLQVLHSVVREAGSVSDSSAADAGAEGTVELGAANKINFAGWSLSQEVAVRPSQEQQRSGWAAKGQLSRTIAHLPITASWQQSDANIWSLGANPFTGRETSIGIDLSRPLRQWLTPGSSASLSYNRVQPLVINASPDEQIRLGVTLGW